MERGNAVVVLGHDPSRDEVVLGNEFRPGVIVAGDYPYRGVHGNPAENEDILTIVLPAKVFIDRVHSGEINDLKTLVAGYWFAKHRA